MSAEHLNMTSATAFGPSSVANLGVGFDALGVALEGPGDLVTASVSRREGIRLVSVKGDRGRLPRDPERNTAAVAATQVLALAKERGSKVKGLDLELETAESRRVLPRLISLSDHIRQGAAFAELVAALHTGDLVAAGRCVSSDRIVEPARAPLVPGHAAVTRAMK